MVISIAALTVARSDFGRMENFYHALCRSPKYRFQLVAGAGHYDRSLGRSMDEVEHSGIPLGRRLPEIKGGSVLQGAAIMAELGCWLEQERPQALILLGDRFEMLAAAQAATLARVPLIHVGGGHLTLGAIDERIRHAITKLSALHFVPSHTCADRVRALNEVPECVFVTGAPELDALVSQPPVTRAAFCKEINLDPNRNILLATFHPETNVSEAENAYLAKEAENALLATDCQILITAPCADPGNQPFVALCQTLAARRPDCRFIPSLGLRRYCAALRHACVMVGNSSSGIIEAATAGLPVVNVGLRQHMRDHATNVIHCPFSSSAISCAISLARESKFAEQSRKVINPYGDGTFTHKAMQIIDSCSWPISVTKKWYVAAAGPHC